jgi:hypothetical protein
MASVTFPVEFGGSGITITDDADPTTGLDGTGYIERFVPALKGTVDMAAHAAQKAGEANQSATTASQAAQQASDDRDSINLDLQTLNGLVSDADASATAAAGSATTASNMADAVAQATATYTSVSAALAATVDGDYFRVINAPDAERISVYRNDAGTATLITTYYTKTGVDAKQAAAVRLNRSLQRLGDYGQTLHSDFNLDAYGLGSHLTGGVQDAMDAEELWDAERLSGTYALQHTADGSLKYVEVPPNTLAREWNPETGKYQAQISGSVTNEALTSESVYGASWTLSTFADGSDSSFTTQGLNGSRFVVTNGRRFYEQPVTLPAGTYCLSMLTESFGEAPTQPLAYFTGAFSDSRVYFDNSNRASATFTLSAETSGVLRWGVGTSTTDTANCDVAIAAIQLVQSTTPGPVIVTEDAPVTRAADNVKRVLGGEFNKSAGTYIVKATPRSTDSFSRVLELSGANQNGLIQLSKNDNRARVFQYLGGATSLNIAGWQDGQTALFGFTFDGSTIIGGFNGVTASMPQISDISTATLLMLGSTPVGGARFDGEYELVLARPYSITESQLQELTTL